MKYTPRCPDCGSHDIKKIRKDYHCGECGSIFEWKPTTKNTGEFLNRVDDWLMGGD